MRSSAELKGCGFVVSSNETPFNELALKNVWRKRYGSTSLIDTDDE